MKKILIASSILILSSTTSAQASQLFIGAQAGQAEMKYDYKLTTSSGTVLASDSSKESNTDIGIRFGMFDHNTRLMASYTKTDDDDFDQEMLLFSADYFFGHGELRPFIGGTMGANRFDSPYDNNTGGDETGFAYGAQAGINYQLTKNLSIDATFQYLAHDNKGKKTIAGITGKIESDETVKAFVALDYKF